MSLFSVSFTRRAIEDFDSTRIWYENHSTDAAMKWILAVEKAIDSLEHDPHRFHKISDQGHFPVLLQELSFGTSRRRTHRMIFAIRSEANVVVYAIRHLAQRELTPDDLLE